MKIRQDAKGLFVQNNRGDSPYRPGPVVGYDHAHDMSDGGLKAGDNPKAQHGNGNPFLHITLDDGRKLLWAPEWMERRSK